MLTEKKLKRYSRQIVFDKIGKKGQEKLNKSKVAILGLGGTGSVCALYLAVAGVNLRLIDRDVVELNNLQRQILYNESDVGKSKAIVAKERLEKKNSNIRIEAFCEDFNHLTAEKLIKDVDLVLDGTDNMETRFLLNDVCVKNNIPFTYTAAIQDKIMFSFIIPGKTACLRCIISKTPKPGSLETCETSGVIGPAPGFGGLISALEAIKYIVGFGQLSTNQLLHIEFSNLVIDTIKVKRNENCKTCQKKEFEFLEREMKETYITTLCGRNSYQVYPGRMINLNLRDLANKVKKNPEFKLKVYNKDVLSLEYRKYPIILFKNGRMSIRNVKSEREAKSIANKILSF